MLNVVLVEPEIAQNAGNIARTCACTGARLHLIEPFGFRLTDKYLKRSGLDYWDKVELKRWPCLDVFLEENNLLLEGGCRNNGRRNNGSCNNGSCNNDSRNNYKHNNVKCNNDKCNCIDIHADSRRSGADNAAKMHLFTGRTDRTIADASFGPDDFLLFGRETAGLPVSLIEQHKQSCVRIPMKDNTRSLNLANSVAIGLYEALRQNGYLNLC